MSWQEKAHRIIARLARESYLKANTSPGGNLYKKHRPYSLPETARALVDALGRNDEERAKAIFVYDYDANRVCEVQP